MIHECELTARSYELDSYGHVNNAVYLNYLEYARHAFLSAARIPYDKLRARGFGLVVSRIDIEYKLPAFFDDRLRIVTTPRVKGRVKCVFNQKILRGEQVVADAEVTWACVGPEGRPVRLPPEMDIPELEP